MFPFSILLGYFMGKSAGKKNTVIYNNAKKDDEGEETTKSTAKNIYNYNYLNDSLTGNTLFSSKEKTNRT